jgi:hypothetical protein
VAVQKALTRAKRAKLLGEACELAGMPQAEKGFGLAVPFGACGLRSARPAAAR